MAAAEVMAAAAVEAQAEALQAVELAEAEAETETWVAEEQAEAQTEDQPQTAATKLLQHSRPKTDQHQQQDRQAAALNVVAHIMSHSRPKGPTLPPNGAEWCRR